MSVVSALIGAGLIAIALRDVFHALFHPSGRGSISELLPKIIWRRSFRKLAKRCPGMLTLGGPTTVLAVILSWTVLLTVGWALIYWPYLPDGFLFATGLEPSNQDGPVDALYLSLATLGYGDITPTGGVLRILVPLEALLGFGLLTAGLSWVLSIYPALSRRRTFAHEIALTRRAESEIGARGMEAGTAERVVLGDFAARLIWVRADMVTFPITYYFHSTDENDSLPANVPYLTLLAERYGDAGKPSVCGPPCCAARSKTSLPRSHRSTSNVLRARPMRSRTPTPGITCAILPVSAAPTGPGEPNYPPRLGIMDIAPPRSRTAYLICSILSSPCVWRACSSMSSRSIRAFFRRSSITSPSCIRTSGISLTHLSRILKR